MITTLLWKRKYFKGWNTLPNEEKNKRLKQLIYWLNWVNHKPHDFLIIKTSNEYKYNPETQRIYLEKNNPSIISSLHELGHHLFGSSELIACRWSIGVFSNCFPITFSKLKWDKHLLKK